MNTQYLDSLPESMRPTAQIFAALGDTTRQKILLLFQKDEEISIKTIVDLFPYSRTTIVHHLEVLERAGIIAPRREGKAALYHVDPDAVIRALRDLGSYIAEEFYEKQPDE
jgi:DNA-binding transcriptional ArsR family regulator